MSCILFCSSSLFKECWKDSLSWIVSDVLVQIHAELVLGFFFLCACDKPNLNFRISNFQVCKSEHVLANASSEVEQLEQAFASSCSCNNSSI